VADEPQLVVVVVVLRLRLRLRILVFLHGYIKIPV